MKYRIGDRFYYAERTFHEEYLLKGTFREEFILVQTRKNECSLVSLTNGNRWQNSIIVEDSGAITEGEFALMVGFENIANFQLIQK
jgi:hypothetical protein